VKTILLIDDMEFEYDLTKELLSAYKITLDWSQDLGAAYRYLESRTPDLILLDLTLGNQDGLEFLVYRNKHESILKIPVLVCSAHGEISTIKRALELGANGYMIKDLDLKKLVKSVRSIGIDLKLLK
jgi:DNA-binding response OmpR family regulator